MGGTVRLGRRMLARSDEGAFGFESRTRTLPDTYGGRGGRFFKDIYDADHVETRQSGRFRWLLSTCLAATVGAVAILVVVYGSADKFISEDGLLPALKSISEGSLPQANTPTPKNAQGLRWITPKSDRLLLTSGALSTRYIIHESIKSRRDGREYVRQKPYAHIVARLAPVAATEAAKIPAFNPFKLYGSSSPVSANADPDEKAGSGLSKTDVSVKVVELLGGILPGEDGQELDAQEVQDIVERTAETQTSPALKTSVEGGEAGEPLDGIGPGIAPAGGGAVSTAQWAPKSATSAQSNTTDIFKSPETADEATDVLDDSQVSVVKAGKDDTLLKILTAAGADTELAKSMIDAAQPIFPASALVPGEEVRITLVPSLTQADKKEPASFSIFSDGHDHLVTVSRDASGEFVGSAQSQIGNEISRSAGDGDSAQSSSLYASLYNACVVQGVPDDTITRLLRINAFDSDFRRRVRPGDALDMFFDMQDEQSTDGPPGELLYSAISSGGVTFKFYRFKTPDGVVDYYDEDGNNSKKFLIRKPVRGEEVRLTSGFGIRYHPLLNVRKMHTGVDWATDPGTPVLAAGSGVIEEVAHKGYYGNYVRIRHANGYSTAYGHMQRFAGGVSEGVRVRQGQVIGFVGSTGLSSGPHLHFEVLVNSRFVDPMSIQVPRERKLEGKDLQDFQKERARIEDLMHRSPVMTASK